MVSCNKGGLFEVMVHLEGSMGEDGPWQVVLKVTNLSVEPNYFDTTLEKCFVGDRGVAVSGNTLVCLSGEKVDDLDGFCTKKAEELLTELKKHPLWGMPGGPDFVENHCLRD